MSKHDAVQNPAHYDLFPGQQVIDIIRATLTPAEFAGYLKGNVLKYRLRAGEKGDPVEDLGKAAKYRTWLYEYRAEGFTPIRSAGPCLKQYEHEATHRDGGGNKFKQNPEGRWMRWGTDSWFYHSDNPKAVPPGLRLLPSSPAYDGHD